MSSTLIDPSVQAFVTGLTYLSATVVLWASICTINFMSIKTPLPNRVAHVLIAVGAAAMLLAPFYLGHTPGIGGATMATGVALLLIAERIYSRKLINRYAARLGQPQRPWWG